MHWLPFHVTWPHTLTQPPFERRPLDAFLAQFESDVRHLAAITDTPPRYLDRAK